MADPNWTVLVPVKRLDRAKTRLRGAVPAAEHEALVLALAADTIAAARACPGVRRVLALSHDPAAAALAGSWVEVLRAPAAGLNDELSWAAGQLPGEPVAVITADLPALRPADLSAALTGPPRAGGAGAGPSRAGRWFVPDVAGTGTTLLARTPGVDLDPRFGPDSARAHARSGAVALAGTGPGLRRDVDTPADLAAAARLGLGRHTRAVLAGTGTVNGVQRLQGTVATYDPDTRSGTVLLDDGSPVDFPATAFDAGGLRLLRLGQRVTMDVDDSGAVTFLTIPTLT